MRYVIKDIDKNTYYQNHPTSNGWYSDNLYGAKIFLYKKGAEKTMNSNNHHVIYPGNRNLGVIPIKIIEEDVEITKYALDACLLVETACNYAGGAIPWSLMTRATDLHEKLANYLGDTTVYNFEGD